MDGHILALDLGHLFGHLNWDQLAACSGDSLAPSLGDFLQDVLAVDIGN